MGEIASTETLSRRQRGPWLRFNVWFLSLGAALIGLHIALPFALQYIHPCAKYIYVDVEALIFALVILLVLSNAAYGVLVGVTNAFPRMREYRHALAAVVILVALAWLLSSFYIVNVIPTLLNDPEMLCD